MKINNYSVIGKKNKHRSPMQTEKSQPSGQRICRKLGEPRFWHHPFTLGSEFLGLHRRPMLGSICLSVHPFRSMYKYPLNAKGKYSKYDSLQFAGCMRKLRGDDRGNARVNAL